LYVLRGLLQRKFIWTAPECFIFCNDVSKCNSITNIFL
uniref:NADH dehydrogenase subunit 1 n=1 Tax=Angiostrongylus cantonensis TaxID=6313 RepID=A0A0K0DKS7_ANGCA